MTHLSMFISMIFIVSCLVMMISLLLSNKSFLDREKISPFECGFDMMNSSRLPFSLRFFLITIIFLIFDVEIVLLLPVVKSLEDSKFLEWYIMFFIFLTILMTGLFHEWNQGALNWSI